MPSDILFVFEMANNHQGSLDHGLKIINEMSKIMSKFRIKAAIKLQYRDLDTFIHPDYISRKDVKHIPRFLETRLTWDDFHSLVYNVHEKNMLAIITAFDEKSIEMAMNHGVDVMKVASCSSMDWPLLEQIAKTGKPIICSTGGCTKNDVDKIVTFFEHRGVTNLSLLHCVALYPTKNKYQNLNFMKRMMKRYPQCTIGYSGHEGPDNLDVVKIAVGMGAKVLERHVGVPTEHIKLNKYSMNPEQTSRWVEAALLARELCGNEEGDKIVTDEEIESLRSLSRGVYSKKYNKKGDLLGKDLVFFAMPCVEGQTSAKEYLETMTASKDYSPNEPIMERRKYDPVSLARSVIHEAKGLIREAQIPINQQCTFELSHHYGMENFRRIGALIINFFNREYCKKLIVLLPGQSHPSHAHRIKEETFQVIYGEMDLDLDGELIQMKPGDMKLIQRGKKHSFSTKIGCIIEEISTTHIKDDSYYEDEQINVLDQIKRKTIIESW